MIDTQAGPGPEAEADALSPADLPADLLALARSRKAAEEKAAADLLEIAARWADLHPPESIHDAAAFTAPGSEHEEPIAGQGCPLVAEFCIAELGSVLGISSIAAKKLIGHGLELRHRLPRLWAQVHAGRVPAWQARMVAETTIHTSPALTRQAVAWVDAQVAAVAGRVGTAQLDRLVAEAIKRFELATEPGPDAEEDESDFHADRDLGADKRHATVDKRHVHYDGLMRLEAMLDLADALDVDQALAYGAAAQKALGSTASLDARRAAALGDLARTQTALDLFNQTQRSDQQDDGFEARSARTSTTESNQETTEPADRAAAEGPDLPTAREVVLHAHFDAHFDPGTTAQGVTVFGPTGRLEEGQRLLLLDQLRSWCTDSRTRITIKPVIDLNTDLSTSGYAIPDRIREQVILRDRTCVFPWCTRPARRCDIDHVVEFDHDADTADRPQPGPTTTSNLAALCRFHHRLKTHSAWRYQTTAPGVFEWTSPHGHRYRRDHTGTTALDPPEPGIPHQRRP